MSCLKVFENLCISSRGVTMLLQDEKNRVVESKTSEEILRLSCAEHENREMICDD